MAIASRRPMRTLPVVRLAIQYVEGRTAEQFPAYAQLQDKAGPSLDAARQYAEWCQ
jgi:hypothetical protein